MVDHHLRHCQRPNRLCEVAESLHVADVEHDQQVDVAERGGALRAWRRALVTEQEMEESPATALD